ncbi:sensor histidine kinase [Thermodesulforhabdus norvegica]|uniref:Signal transduction histidine kinase n=1 Tax=Thermodesulforhabdus norvegica TaxID=39841 RepID=A0A1I4RDV6_9BACT|nr:HAMP domain-containing histidine kinase [Thermodesulforhabdus norvegica]SFM50216.1 Signal transduction histidine kinase [Thermodesulforhabdus norvegica]
MKEKNKLTVRFIVVITFSFLTLCAWTSLFFYLSLKQLNQTIAKPVTLLYGTTLFLGGCQLIAVSSLLFREFLLRFFEEKERMRWFHEMFLYLLSHKVGNFLLAQKLNASILEKNFSPEAVMRIKQGLSRIEADFRQILALIETFSRDYIRQKPFNPAELVDSVLGELGRMGTDSGLRVRKSYYLSRIRANMLETRIMLLLLLENAFKYAGRKVSIRVGSYKKKPYVAVVNDLGSEKSPGTGMGLIFSERLASQMKVKFRYGIFRGKFSVLFMWP